MEFFLSLSAFCNIYYCFLLFSIALYAWNSCFRSSAFSIVIIVFFLLGRFRSCGRAAACLGRPAGIKYRFAYTKKVSRRMVQSKSPSTKGKQTKGVWSTTVCSTKKPAFPEHSPRGMGIECIPLLGRTVYLESRITHRILYCYGKARTSTAKGALPTTVV